MEKSKIKPLIYIAWANQWCGKEVMKSSISLTFKADVATIYSVFKAEKAEIQFFFYEQRKICDTELEPIAYEELGTPVPEEEGATIEYEMHLDLTTSNLSFKKFNELLQKWNGLDWDWQ